MSIDARDRAEIERAVAQAEVTTRGELVCAVIEEASSYPEIPLAWAGVAALASPIALLGFGWAPDWLAGWGGWRIAHIDASHAVQSAAVASYAFVQAVLFATLVVLLAQGPIRRLLTPHFVKRARVRRRAEEYFVARALDKTHERTGVLIFASIKDRTAVIIADEGISLKVDAKVWREAVSALVAGMRANDRVGGLLAAIERCARVLALHFPPRPDNPNEIPDAPSDHSRA